VYGLDAEERELRFGAGGEEFSLRSGDKTPVGADSYVSVGGSPTVYTVRTTSVNAFRKGLDDLRDKRILHFDVASVDALEASWPGGRVALVRGDEGWRLKEPLEGPADEETVETLLSNLSFLRASGFVDDPPSDRKAGLSRPDFEVELVVGGEGEGGDQRRLRLQIGRERDGKTRLVRAARPNLYRIAADRIADFPRDVVAYRYRQLAKFASTDATRLEIVFEPEAGEAMSAEPVTITATRGATGWKADPEPFREGALTTLVSELSRLRAEGILAERMGPDELRALRLAPPAVVYRVYGTPPGGGEGASETQLAEVAIGAPHGGDRIAARRGDRETVFEIDHALAEYIPVSLEAFRNRFAAKAAKAEEPGEAEAGPGGEGEAPSASADDSP
jgi:hypothetical protein